MVSKQVSKEPFLSLIVACRSRFTKWESNVSYLPCLRRLSFLFRALFFYAVSTPNGVSLHFPHPFLPFEALERCVNLHSTPRLQRSIGSFTSLLDAACCQKIVSLRLKLFLLEVIPVIWTSIRVGP